MEPIYPNPNAAKNNSAPGMPATTPPPAGLGMNRGKPAATPQPTGAGMSRDSAVQLGATLAIPAIKTAQVAAPAALGMLKNPLVKGAGMAHLAAAGIGGAVKGGGTSTADYAQRMGAEEGDPTTGSLVDKNWAVAKNAAIRSAGVLADVGNAATFGYADKLGNLMAGNGFTPTAATAPQPTQAAAETAKPQPTQAVEWGIHRPKQGAAAQPTSAPGMYRVNAPNSAPLYTDNPSQPALGMNTKAGVNGQVGNTSNLGMDKAAIERGMLAERDLHATKLAAMDSNQMVSGGGVVSMGDPDQAAKDQQARFISDQRHAASSIHSSKSEKRAALGALAQFSGDAASIENNQHNNASALGMNRNNNATALQRGQIEQQGKAPGMQLDNQSKSLANTQSTTHQKLMSSYLALNDANDPGGAQRKTLTSQLQAIAGKTPSADNKFKVVETGGGVDPATMIPGAKSAFVFNQETGQYQPMAGQAPTAPSVNPPAKAIADLNKDPKLAAQFDAKYGAGAAARMLGQG